MLDKLIKNKKDEMVTVRPNMNIYFEGEKIVVAVEMPGVDKDSLEINLENNNLFIRGRKRKEEVDKEYKELYKERLLVEYERIFELNADIDKEKIDANYENGILKVILNKTETAKPKRIEIKL